jgi:hypothetical protein
VESWEELGVGERLDCGGQRFFMGDQRSREYQVGIVCEACLAPTPLVI